MNVDLIKMPRAKAREAFLEYRNAVRARHTEEDEALMRGYRAMSQGHQLLDVGPVIHDSPIGDDGNPCLAICRADQKYVQAIRWTDGVTFYWGKAIGTWGMNHAATRSQLRFACPGMKRDSSDARGVVPAIPPRLRPKGSLTRFHLLWEVEDWQTVPGDPLLLRHLQGTLYAVLAQWDLTKLEQAVLRGLRPLPN